MSIKLKVAPNDCNAFTVAFFGITFSPINASVGNRVAILQEWKLNIDAKEYEKNMLHCSKPSEKKN